MRHVDRRIMVARRQVPGEDDVAVKDRARVVGDRLVEVVALDQDRIERGDAAGFGRPGPLHQPRQQREDRRRVAFGRRRFARRQPDLALGHGEAGDRVHHQDHVFSLVAEIFRDRRSRQSGLQADQRRLVGGGDDHDHDFFKPSSPSDSSIKSRTSRPRSPTRAMTLTSASALRAIIPMAVDLPTPEPAKMPMRWPRPMVSMPSIARMPHAHDLGHARALDRVGRIGVERPFQLSQKRSLAVDRLAQAAQYPAQDIRADPGHQRLAGRGHLRTGGDPRGGTQRHQEDPAFPETDDFRQ